MTAQGEDSYPGGGVLVFAPVGQDADLTHEFLRRASIPNVICRSMTSLCDIVERGGGGTLLLTEEALDDPAGSRLTTLLDRQPSWSDIPVLLFAGSSGADMTLRTIQSLESLRNVTLFERPVRVAAVLSAVRAALRARARQYQVRATEERLRTVIESIQDYAIITLDADGRITSWNDGARRMTGYEADEVLGRSVDRFYPPDDVAAGKPARELQRAVATGRSEDESWRLRKDRSTLWVNEIVRPLRDSHGRVTGFTTISRDLTERKAFEDALQRGRDSLEARVRERTAEVQSLFSRLVSAQEEERRRIARDIHDQLGQQMTALRMNLESLRARATGALLTDQLERTQRIAEELDESIDFLTWELRPAALDHLGLSAALPELVTGWSERFGIGADFDVPGADDVRLERDVETNLYRIVQEALHNIVKHAGATQVTVVLERSQHELVLVIEDNGRGFNPAAAGGAGGLGLLSMRERAALAGGQLEIESAPGAGTSIFVRIPVGRAA